MKEALNNFVSLLIKGDFLLVFLVIMILVIVSVIFYLVKLELNQRSYLEDKDEEDEITKTIESTLEFEPEEPLENVVEINKYDSPESKTLDTKTNDVLNIVSNYENEQEESAIISADELDNRIKELKDTKEENVHDKEIERYENEQEEKAIISYDELLKRASIGVINYEKEQDLGGIRVSKVDFEKSKTITISDESYAREESFLQALKEFRRSL